MSSTVVVQSPGSVDQQAGTDARELAKWQRKLLPFMTRFLVVIAVAFFALSAYDVYELRRFVGTDSPQPEQQDR